jgi:hypothetical protein
MQELQRCAECEAMTDNWAGSWVAYYSDWSSLSIFHSEIDALRFAVDKSMDVIFVPDGESPMHIVREQWEAYRLAREVQEAKP